MESLYGRHVLQSEINDNIMASCDIIAESAFETIDGQPFCRRCHSKIARDWLVPDCHHCQQRCYYCRHCLTMTRITSCDNLYSYPEPNAFQFSGKCCWEGKLSAAQARVSEELVAFIHSERRQHLVWAVTGAGKTEMLFHMLETAFRLQWRVAVVSPRVDVVLELYPRFTEAFPEVSTCLLHGKANTPYQYTQFLISTVHQLWRFKQAFDLIVVDEIDAFPFKGDESLAYAIDKALKDNGKRVALTATPSTALQQEVAHNTLSASLLPARYHRHPLVVPQAIWVGDWRRSISHWQHHSRLAKTLRKLLSRDRRYLIFMPNISLMTRLRTLLEAHFPNYHLTSVHAADPQRIEKVAQMRSADYQALLTTTILERGVTFTDIDVIIIGAEDRVFDTASLVQIAGRVGRKADFPTGAVYFLHHGWSRAMRQAVAQITAMNTMSKKSGLIQI